MRDYEAYLFDWDGTLMQSIDIWSSEIRNRYAKYDIERTDQEIGAGLGDWDKTLEPVPVDQRKAFTQELLEAAYGRYPSAPLFDGVESTLQKLKADHKKIALITTSHRKAIDQVLAKHGLQQYFDLLVTSEDVKNHKPDPEGILFALAHLRVAKEKAVMIGDTDKDLGAAKNASIDSVLFYPELHQKFYVLDHLQTFKPTRILSTWNELLA